MDRGPSHVVATSPLPPSQYAPFILLMLRPQNDSPSTLRLCRLDVSASECNLHAATGKSEASPPPGARAIVRKPGPQEEGGCDPVHAGATPRGCSGTLLLWPRRPHGHVAA